MTTGPRTSSTGGPCFLVSGVIGVKADAAGEAELIGIAHQWARDQGFRALVVRHVDEENFGFHFVHVSDSPNREKIDACVAGLREAFGKDCIHRLDIASQTASLDSVASPVAALRGLSGED